MKNNLADDKGSAGQEDVQKLKKIPANSYIGEGYVEEQISNDGDADLFYKDFGKHT